MNSDLHPDDIVDTLIDEGINAIEVIDERTGLTMAAAWLFISEDGSLVIDNLEIHADYEADAALMNRVGEEMIQYAAEFAAYIGSNRLYIGMPGHGKYFGDNGMVKTKYADRVTNFGQEKIGGYLGEKYYLDSAGKGQAYLVWQRTTQSGPTQGKESVEEMLSDIRVRETGPGGQPSASNDLMHMVRPRRFAHFSDALTDVYHESPQAPALIFLNDKTDLKLLEATLEKIEKQNRTGQSSFALVTLSPELKNDRMVEAELSRLEREYKNRVLLAHRVAERDFPKRSDGFHYEEMFGAFAEAEPFRGNAVIREMLEKLRLGDANIGTRVVQVNSPNHLYVGGQNILALLIRLLPEKEGAVLFDYRTFLLQKKMA